MPDNIIKKLPIRYTKTKKDAYSKQIFDVESRVDSGSVSKRGSTKKLFSNTKLKIMVDDDKETNI